jgi:hypothetical protein
MDTRRVKNIIITLLVALNAALALLTALREGRHAVSGARADNIRKLLARGGISLDAEITRRFGPADTIEVLPYEYDIHGEAARFFSDTSGLREDAKWNGESLTGGEGVLTLEDGFLMFEAAEPYSTREFERGGSFDAAARALADRYVSVIKPEGLTFRLSRTATEADGAVYDYRGWFGGAWLYSSYIKITVAEGGVIKARCFYSGVPRGFTGNPREVYAPDEALFALCKQLRAIYGGAAVSITSMAVVYNLAEPAGEAARAVPCYLFEIRVREAGRMYLVECYTNAVVK